MQTIQDLFATRAASQIGPYGIAVVVLLWARGSIVTISHPNIAQETGICNRQVIRVLTDLQARNIITRTGLGGKGRGMTNTYTILPSTEWIMGELVAPKPSPISEATKILRKRSRIRKMKCKGKHTAEEWLALVAHYGGKCIACGKGDRPLTEDHIVPLVLGGSDDIVNIQPLCPNCNSEKGTTVIDYRFCQRS